MAEVSDSGRKDVVNVEVAGVVGQVAATKLSKWYLWRKDGKALISYLLDSEVHTFAFSVAANAILSFIPLIVLLYTLSWSVFDSKAMADVVSEMVDLFIPSNQGFYVYWLQKAGPHHGVQALSLVMILVSCTGIFLPLEVALNQAWGVTKSRNYLLNQLVAFGLAIAMVGLALLSIFLNTIEKTVLAFILFHNTDWFIYGWINSVWLAISTGAACIVFLFLIYWLLPNRKVPWRPVLRTSIWTGLIWLGAKYAFVAILPHMDLNSLYGPFRVSVALILWAYASGLILFAGAQFSVSRWGDKKR